jgi:maltose alpha-D-glucosyltransferase/alpha-amylase
MGGCRVRCHGNYHLERLLHTGKDFIITHFDGDPSRTLGERRIKRSPLRDVAGMVRSFDYAAQCVLLGLANYRGRAPGIIRPEDRRALSPWAAFWSNRVAREFVRSYLEQAEPDKLLPGHEQTRKLLDVFLLEQALSEVEFESLHRPEWLRIALSGVLRLLGCDPSLPEMVG